MARGRKPKNPKVIELQGAANHRSQAPLAPTASPGALAAPDWFGDEALFAWKFWTASLAEMGVMHKVDSLALQGACAAYERAIRHERTLLETPRDWRADIAAGRAWNQVRAFCLEFGLTLVSRNRVQQIGGGVAQLELDLEQVIGQ